MTTTWLPGAHVYDLRKTRGNGPFRNFQGLCLHVNVDEHGTSDSFYAAGASVNPNSVTPNFQVYKSEAAGGVHQYLPFNWQPWCQADGNTNYAAVETAGLPTEPLTEYQIEQIARIVAVYHAEMGMPLTLANKPGIRGFITHAAGGESWGGHPCPGSIRTAQRHDILVAANLGDSNSWEAYMADRTDAQLTALIQHAVQTTPIYNPLTKEYASLAEFLSTINREGHADLLVDQADQAQDAPTQGATS